MHPVLRTSLFAVALSAFPVAAAIAADLTVEVAGIRAQAGHLQIALVDSDAGWNNRSEPVRAHRVVPEGKSLTVVFDGLAPGQYAVMVMHDENGNGKLDTNLVGIPVEGYGFSNNPRVMRKPTWEESRFEFGGDAQAITVDLR